VTTIKVAFTSLAPLAALPFAARGTEGSGLDGSVLARSPAGHVSSIYGARLNLLWYLHL